MKSKAFQNNYDDISPVFNKFENKNQYFDILVDEDDQSIDDK